MMIILGKDSMVSEVLIGTCVMYIFHSNPLGIASGRSNYIFENQQEMDEWIKEHETPLW